MKSAVHNLSHEVKLSGNMGELLPVGLFDVVPGDKIAHNVSALIRTQPLLAPLMHTVDIDIHTFFCPQRVIWDESEDFHSGGDLGTADPTPPYMMSPASTGYAANSLADYLGLPLGVPDLKHSAEPFRVYNTVYNHYYRDSQLQTELTSSTASGLDTTSNRTLANACWKRDYFTAARPNPQLGPEVFLPFEGEIPVTGFGKTDQTYSSGSQPLYEAGASAVRNVTSSSTGTFRVEQDPDNPGFPNIFAVLADAIGIPIRAMRESNAVQRWLEHNNMWGGRYMEQMFSRFGAFPQDFRLQWPEFLGHGHSKLQFSEVLQTAEGDDPVGEMRGHGIGLTGTWDYRRKIPEHGWIMVCMVLRPKTQYMQGLHRSWSRETRYDYFLPEFQDVGDQAVLNKEVYAAHTNKDLPFGYSPMYDEYRWIPSRVCGDFRTTLKFWHMSREFSSDPALNATFVTANPTDRVYPATLKSQIYVTVQHKITARRRLRKQPAYRLM